MDLEICRLCLSKLNLMPIFMDLSRWSNYSDVLMLTTGIKIEPDDGLPQKICTNCKTTVQSAFNLREQSRQTELTLLQQGYKRSSESDQTLKVAELLDFRPVTAAGKDKFSIHSPLPPLNNPEESSINGNIFKTKSTNDSSHENNYSSYYNENDCSNNDGLDISVTVECDRVSDNGGDEERWPPIQEKTSRIAKREMYLNLVDGDFDPNGPVKCKVCKSIVKGWRCFTSHAQKHLGFKYVCEYCGKSFISTTQLKRHCMSHHGMERELRCKHCSYLALDNVQLKLHERRMHTGERPYVCDHCSASYHSRPCLIQHLESHRTLASVQCGECPRAFKSRRQLARHRYAAHASGARARCRLCGNQYSPKYLRTHIAERHGDVGAVVK